MVWKALTYSTLGEYAPHLNYHHHNGGTELRLVQSVTASGGSIQSTERTCNGGTGWELVYHMTALSHLGSFQVAQSATNQICQTPPWTPATSILYYVLNDWHWCCNNCRCLLQYITGLVVPATTQPQCLQNIIYIGGGKQWQTTPKNLPRMQRTRAIPVDWLSSRLYPDRPKGWIPIIIIIIYIGCPRKNVPDFGRMFLMLNYTEITQNTYIQSWTVKEIMAREVWKYDSCYTLIDYQIHIKTGRNMWFL